MLQDPVRGKDFLQSDAFEPAFWKVMMKFLFVFVFVVLDSVHQGVDKAFRRASNTFSGEERICTERRTRSVTRVRPLEVLRAEAI